MSPVLRPDQAVSWTATATIRRRLATKLIRQRATAAETETASNAAKSPGLDS